MKATVLMGILAAALLHAGSPASNSGSDATSETADAGAPEKAGGGAGRFGLGIKASTLGAGIEGAVSVARRINLRGGFNTFRYEDSFNSSGITYTGRLSLRSVTANADFYVLGPLHFSPGVLLYNDNRGSAKAFVPGGQTFTLGGVTYLSSTANPANGSASLGFNSAAPEFLIGLGNLVPRSRRHFTANFEVGAAYLGQPAVKLNLGGTVCTPSGVGCVNAATDPTVQANVRAQQDKLNHNLRYFKFYPIVSLGFGYRF